MNDFKTRMLTALSIGAIVGLISTSTGFSNAGYLSTIIICIISSGFSYWYVHNWRTERGFDHSGPITNYFFVVLLSWLLFGFLLTPKNSFAPIGASIAISILLPPFFELLREFGTIFSKDENKSKNKETQKIQ
jgi:uncharacterized membrane protein YeaQ/YmgE (transglycosylase-associated protein family)